MTQVPSLSLHSTAPDLCVPGVPDEVLQQVIFQASTAYV